MNRSAYSAGPGRDDGIGGGDRGTKSKRGPREDKTEEGKARGVSDKEANSISSTCSNEDPWPKHLSVRDSHRIARMNGFV